MRDIWELVRRIGAQVRRIQSDSQDRILITRASVFVIILAADTKVSLSANGPRN